MSTHRKDQVTCEKGLKLLSCLALHFSGTEDNELELEKSREIAKHMIKAFW